nr:S8 family serine peptidase [Pseudomarimonas arenosa]
MVKFREALDSDGAKSLLSKAGAKLHHRFEDGKALALSVSSDQLETLRRDPAVEFVEPDPIRWPLAQSTPYGIALVQGNELRSAGAIGSNVLVCVVDSGLQSGHPDLVAANITGGYPSNWNSDTCGHGTHVAGTAAAANNSIGVIGVAPNAKLYAVKVFGGGSDGCAYTYGSTILDAAQRCAAAGQAQGRKVVINLSLGGAQSSTIENSGFQTLYNSGNVLSVAAAGNDGNTAMSYPASYDSVISVGAIDSNRALASFSQRNAQLELAAPGVAIHSTLPYLNGSLSVSGTTYAAASMGGSVQAQASAALISGGLCTTVNANWSGKVVLCERGSNPFYAKEAAVRQSGGVATVVYNNVSGGFDGTLEGYSSVIPIVSLSHEDGLSLLQTRIGQPATVITTRSAGSGYGSQSGTSMAAPHVAGVAAAIWSKNTSKTAAQVRAALTSTAQDLGAAGRDSSFGYGLVRGHAAMLALNPVDSVAPSTPASLTASLSATRITLSWPASTDSGGSGLAGYKLERCSGASCSNFTQISAPSTTSFADSGVAANTLFRYRVRAVDAAGNHSGYSTIASATTGAAGADTTAPTAPASLSATVLSSTSIRLNWAAASDSGGSGLAGYRIFRCTGSACTNLTQVGTATTTSFTNSGLAARTAYTYRVRAVDGAGNLGAYSPVSVATTSADLTAPSAISQLTLVVTSSSAINLSWSAATDSGGAGLAGYKIERCQGAACSNFAQVGTATTTSFAQTGLLKNTTYRFRVRAYDRANNNGAYSPLGSATTRP